MARREPNESVTDTPVLEETSRHDAAAAAEAEESNNRGNFTRNLNKEADHIVAKKMFLGGLAFLPWLHFVNVIFYRKQFLDPSIDASITLWVRRSFMGFCFWTVLFVSWVLLFQLNWKDFGWQNLVMVVPAEDENAGW
uniref:Gamma-secretase subunit PEN-2 n=1 Tax=Peronospora matthiolae TaxID=2874970 RepID=A0AAV1TME9_9STRA